MGYHYPVVDSDSLRYGEAVIEGISTPTIAHGGAHWRLSVNGGKISLQKHSPSQPEAGNLSYEDWVVTAARFIAREAHKGGVDIGGNDYFRGHVSTVAHKVSEATHADAYSVATAYVHDVLEDSEITEEELLKVLPLEVVDAVAALTHSRESGSYYEYLERVAQNPLALTVKQAEVEDNRDVTRLREVTDKDAERLVKYDYANRYIGDKMAHATS